jgi:hypothetical protein
MLLLTLCSHFSVSHYPSSFGNSDSHARIVVVLHLLFTFKVIRCHNIFTMIIYLLSSFHVHFRIPFLLFLQTPLQRLILPSDHHRRRRRPLPHTSTTITTLSPPATTTPTPTPMPERAVNPFRMEREPKQRQPVVWALGYVFFVRLFFL